MFNKAKDYYKNLKSLKLIYGNELVSSYLSLKNINNITDQPPASGNILVVVPHPGDELVGVGGTLRLHVKNKDMTKVIYIADGSSSFPSNYRPTSNEKQGMADKRELEARDSMELIGITDLSFLEYKDRKFLVNDNVRKFMNQVILKIRPDAIYTPYFFDSDQDHRQVLKLVLKSIEESKIQTKVVMYEVWEPLIANYIVSIDGVASDKEEALKIHKSQLGSINYLYASMGLSAYRGAVNEAGDYAEAFLVLDSGIALKLYEKISRVINQG